MGKRQSGQRGGWRRWTSAEAREVILDWRASGESGAAYSARHGFSVQRLYWWSTRLSESFAVAKPVAVAKPAPRFLAVQVVDRNAASQKAARVDGHVSLQRGEVTVHLWSGASAVDIRLVVEALTSGVACG